MRPWRRWSPNSANQRTSLGVRGSRCPGKGGSGCDHLSLGLDRAVRNRQGDKIPSGSCALLHGICLGHEQTRLRGDVDATAECDRRPLQSGMGRKNCGSLGRFRTYGHRQTQDRARPEVYALTNTQLDQWKAAAGPVVQTWSAAVSKAGSNPDEALTDLKAELAKSKSEY
jgi:hypothetical protein